MVGVVVGGSGRQWVGEGDGGDGGMRFGNFEILRKMGFLKWGQREKVLHAFSFGFFFYYKNNKIKLKKVSRPPYRRAPKLNTTRDSTPLQTVLPLFFI
jgi:hypothetical protein